jgi:hypothetical protein
MPIKNQRAYSIKCILINKLRIYTFSLWRDLYNEATNITFANLLQAAMNASRLIAAMAIEGHIYNTPAVTAHLQGSTASFYEVTIGESKDGKTATLQQPPAIPPSVIADPRTDDRIIHAARETQNTCFNCGKIGYWAKDCKAQSKWSKDSSSPKGEAVTFKVIFFPNSQLARKMKNYINKRKANLRQNRVYIIDSAIINSNSDPNFDDLTDSDSIAKFKNENFYNILRQMAAVTASVNHAAVPHYQSSRKKENTLVLYFRTHSLELCIKHARYYKI